MQLPLELLETIIRRLADSRSTLRACTLVCKAWHPAALRVLFRDFTLRIAHSDRLHAGLAFPHYVSRLIIGGSYQHDQPARFGDVLRLFDHVSAIRVSVVRSARLVPLLPSIFPHLCDLDLNSNKHRVPFLRWLSAHPPMLQHITLYNLEESELQSTGTFLRTLGTHLRTLDIGFTDHSPTSAQAARLSLSTNTHLQALRVSFSDISSLSNLSILLALLDADTPALHCVILELPSGQTIGTRLDDPEWGALDALLTRCAPMLNCLHIYAYEHHLFASPGKHELERLVLAQMPHCAQSGVFAGIDWDALPLLKNIQALRLQISNCADFIRDDSSCARTLASARSILAGTTSPWKHPIILDSDVPALRCITLFFPEKTSFRGQEWRALDVMLARRAPALDCLHNNTEDRRN
ncbi:hypothetical protein BD779DRAFT_1666916 [Infundibulicybe gibba]|nr:hypothetical protein BD779DRAFT_1666916 [Infundibulicybe gibba]